MPSEFDMGRMQEEAVRRAREMQARAHIPPRQSRSGMGNSAPSSSPERRPAQPHVPPQPDPPSSPEEQREAAPSPQSFESASSQAVDNHSAGLLESLFQDKERTIILALLILLSGEESNHELMFALMFLLM